MALPLMTMVTGSSQIGKLIDMNEQAMLAHIADKLKDRELFPAKIAQAKRILSTAKLPGRMVLKSVTSQTNTICYDAVNISIDIQAARLRFTQCRLDFDITSPLWTYAGQII